MARVAANLNLMTIHFDVIISVLNNNYLPYVWPTWILENLLPVFILIHYPVYLELNNLVRHRVNLVCHVHYLCLC